MGIVGSPARSETSSAVNVASRWSELMNNEKFKWIEFPGKNSHSGFEQHELNETGLSREVPSFS